MPVVSLPTRERGLKLQGVQRLFGSLPSLPTRERELKHKIHKILFPPSTSLPTRERELKRRSAGPPRAGRRFESVTAHHPPAPAPYPARSKHTPHSQQSWYTRIVAFALTKSPARLRVLKSRPYVRSLATECQHKGDSCLSARSPSRETFSRLPPETPESPERGKGKGEAEIPPRPFLCACATNGHCARRRRWSGESGLPTAMAWRL